MKWKKKSKWTLFLSENNVLDSGVCPLPLFQPPQAGWHLALFIRSAASSSFTAIEVQLTCALKTHAEASWQRVTMTWVGNENLLLHQCKNSHVMDVSTSSMWCKHNTEVFTVLSLDRGHINMQKQSSFLFFIYMQNYSVIMQL